MDRILIVEDEDRARRNLVRLMEDSGYEVYASANASEAKDLLSTKQFDVVITDMLMEDEQAGVSVLKTVKEKDDLTQVIIITAYGSIKNAVETTKLGAFDYIEKDTDDVNDVLKAKVAESIKRRQEQMEQASQRPLKFVLDRQPTPVGEYDVMVLYNSEDADQVEAICEQLEQFGVKPWFDKYNLLPDWIFLEELDRILKCTRSVAVVVGKEGIPLWDHLEVIGFLEQVASHNVPIIPVILDNVEELTDFPSFLTGMNWVDFRNQDPDPMQMLLWSITGETGFQVCNNPFQPNFEK